MKNKILLFIYFFIFTHLSFGQITVDEKTLEWDYPVKPGAKEWAKFETGQQMSKACQIPLEILNAISTSELAKICLNYPLSNEYLAFNDERIGINTIIKNFNGLTELSQRKGGIQELIQIYAGYPVLTQIQDDASSKDYHIPYRLPFLELLLSDDIFLSQLNSKELAELRKIVTNKYAGKVQNTEVYSLFNIKKTMLLATIIIDKQTEIALSTEQQDIIKAFIKNYNHPDPDLLTETSKIISEL
ncbi:hypothetical protein FACS1894160_1790 [Bacteroidia bacterium]|nr:hypothetical protein FACS1894160_1790 [Bacteroidia bacterium]